MPTSIKNKQNYLLKNSVTQPLKKLRIIWLQ